MVLVVKVVMAKSKIAQENQLLIEKAGTEFLRDLYFSSDIYDHFDFLHRRKA